MDLSFFSAIATVAICGNIGAPLFLKRLRSMKVDDHSYSHQSMKSILAVTPCNGALPFAMFRISL